MLQLQSVYVMGQLFTTSTCHTWIFFGPNRLYRVTHKNWSKGVVSKKKLIDVKKWNKDHTKGYAVYFYFHQLRTHLLPAMTLLRNRFGYIISHQSEFQWPAKSPDLFPLDCFPWGYVKQRVFTAEPDALNQFKKVVREIVSCID